MVDLPNPFGPDLEIGLPWNNDKPTDEVKDFRRDRKWDGTGKPPSRRAAVMWLVQHTAMSQKEANEFVGQKGTLTEVGQRVRQEFGRRKAAREEREARDPEKLMEKAAADGEVDAAEMSDIEALIAGGPLADPTDKRGAPLWRFEGDPEMLAGITVENKSGPSTKTDGSRWIANRAKRVGARYFEQDTLEPLKWSAEQRADLQRVMHGIGLYGDAKVKLGSWTAKDQATYAEVLASANEEGMTWTDLLAKWKRQPPEDLLAEVKGQGSGGRAPLVVQHTNPMDIMSTSRQVSRNLTGEVDRGFVEGTVGAYQGVETAAQTAAYSAAESGGTVTDAPSVDAFAEDQLRRSNPIEVDGYQFLTQFQSLMSMLGVQ